MICETMIAFDFSQVFAKCGSKIIVYCASKYDVPAFAIQAIGDRFCLGATLLYALQSIDNGTVISEAMVISSMNLYLYVHINSTRDLDFVY